MLLSINFNEYKVYAEEYTDTLVVTKSEKDNNFNFHVKDGKTVKEANYGAVLLTNPTVKQYLDMYNDYKHILLNDFNGAMPTIEPNKSSAGYWYRSSNNIITQEGRSRSFLFVLRVNNKGEITKYEPYIRNKSHSLTGNDFYARILARKDSGSNNFNYYFSYHSIYGGPPENGHPIYNSYKQDWIGTAVGRSSLKIFRDSNKTKLVDSSTRMKILKDLNLSGIDYDKSSETPKFDDVFTSSANDGTSKKTRVRRIFPSFNEGMILRSKLNNGGFTKEQISNGYIINTNSDAIKFLKKAIEIYYFDFDKAEWKLGKNGKLFSESKDKLKFDNLFAPQTVGGPFSTGEALADGTLIRLRTRRGAAGTVGWYNPGPEDTRYFYYKVVEGKFEVATGADWGNDKDTKSLNNFITVQPDDTISKNKDVRKDVKHINILTPLSWKYDLERDTIANMKVQSKELTGSVAWPKNGAESERESLLVEIVFDAGIKEYYKLDKDIITIDNKIDEALYKSLLDENVAEHEEYKGTFIPGKISSGSLSMFFKSSANGSYIIPKTNVTAFEMEIKKHNGIAYAFERKGNPVSSIKTADYDRYYLIYITVTKGSGGTKKKFYKNHSLLKINKNDVVDNNYLNTKVETGYKAIQNFLFEETNGAYLTLDVYNNAIKDTNSSVALVTNFSSKTSGSNKVFSMDPAWIMYLLKSKVIEKHNFNSNNFYFPITEVEVLVLNTNKKKNEKDYKKGYEFRTTVGDTKKAEGETVLTNYRMGHPGKTISFSLNNNDLQKKTNMALKVYFRKHPKRLGHLVGVQGDASTSSSNKDSNNDSNDVLLYVVDNFKSNNPTLRRVTELTDEFEDDSTDASADVGSISKALKITLVGVSANYNDSTNTTELVYKFKTNADTLSNAKLLPYYVSLNSVGSFKFSTINSSLTEVVDGSELTNISKFFEYTDKYKWNKIDLKYDGSSLNAFTTKGKTGTKKGTFTVYASLKNAKIESFTKRGKFKSNDVNLFGIKFIVIEGSKIRLLDPN